MDDNIRTLTGAIANLSLQINEINMREYGDISNYIKTHHDNLNNLLNLVKNNISEKTTKLETCEENMRLLNEYDNLLKENNFPESISDLINTKKNSVLEVLKDMNIDDIKKEIEDMNNDVESITKKMSILCALL